MADGPAYVISEFEVRYVRENAGHPDPREVLRLRVRLGQTLDGYVVPRPGVPTVIIGLAEVQLLERRTFYASALQRILEEIRDFHTARSLMGVYVAPDPFQIDEGGRDLRPADDTSLTIVVTTGIVTEMRTLAAGERFGADERIDHPRHRRILEGSPIRPHAEGRPAGGDLLRKDELDRYLYFRSRHPGRQVDASLAPAAEPGGAALDLLITENRPFIPYAQLSNTGTPETDRMVYRFGFVHTQLTDADDILSFDYITAGLDESHAVFGSYERPFDNERVRWRVFGNYQEYTADQVGFLDEDFEGDSWGAGGEIIANVHQDRELFLDLVAGGRFEHVHVDNDTLALEGDGDFVLPYVGLRLDRTTEWYSTTGHVDLEWQVASNRRADLEALGRVDPDERWLAMHWSLEHSVYLEPLLDRAAWEDPGTPGSSQLAHEIAASFRGQHAFGDRLIPQAEQVAGGLYTVRGYPQSATAGDTVLLATIEYRYHLPRTFEIEPEPRQLFGTPFRLAPQYVYGRPDWDLVLKGFLDYGRTINSDRRSFEDDEDLLGIGVGVDLQIRRNVNARLDWGFVLQELESAKVNDGSNRVHFVITLLF